MHPVCRCPAMRPPTCRSGAWIGAVMYYRAGARSKSARNRHSLERFIRRPAAPLAWPDARAILRSAQSGHCPHGLLLPGQSRLWRQPAAPGMRAPLACKAECPSARGFTDLARRAPCAGLLSAGTPQAYAGRNGEGMESISAAGLSSSAASVAAESAMDRRKSLVRGGAGAGAPEGHTDNEPVRLRFAHRFPRPDASCIGACSALPPPIAYRGPSPGVRPAHASLPHAQGARMVPHLPAGSTARTMRHQGDRCASRVGPPAHP